MGSSEASHPDSSPPSRLTGCYAKNSFLVAARSVETEVKTFFLAWLLRALATSPSLAVSKRERECSSPQTASARDPLLTEQMAVAVCQVTHLGEIPLQKQQWPGGPVTHMPRLHRFPTPHSRAPQQGRRVKKVESEWGDPWNKPDEDEGVGGAEGEWLFVPP